MYQPLVKWLQAYANRRMLVVFMLGFSSGLPLALAGGTLQAWFKTSGASLILIGYMTMVSQPYSYKFLWAPLLDKFVPLQSLGQTLDRRRSWMLSMQLALIAVIMLMAYSNPSASIFNVPVLLILAFCLSAFSATQDIAIDAYRIEVLKHDERGLGTALGVEGYRIAMIASGGFALFLADRYGWQTTYLIMASLMAVGLLATAIAPPVAADNNYKNINLKELIVNSFKDFLKRDKAWLLLVLIISYKLSDAFADALATAFFLDLNFSLAEVGLMNKVIGMIATLVGIMLGGLLMTRLGLFRSLLFFGVLSAVTNLLFMLLAIAGKNFMIASSAVFIGNICAGMGTAAFVALIMSLCSTKYTATQFALLSSLTAVGRVYVGPVSGHMVEAIGWANFYCFTAIVAVPCLLLLVYLRSAIDKRDADLSIAKDAADMSTDRAPAVVATNN